MFFVIDDKTFVHTGFPVKNKTIPHCGVMRVSMRVPMLAYVCCIYQTI